MTKQADTKPTTDAPTPERLDLRSHDIAADKMAELLRIFPDARTEGAKVDFERLRRALGEAVDTGKERFGLTWPGKADCFKTIQQPSMGTLRPCPKESVDWDTTENLIIEGDNLEVLKLLQKSYLGKVKMIYIDPPYNTGNDFIYPDNYAESLQTYLAYTGQVDSEGRKFGTNTDTDGRFHSKWLNMMYPRVYLARNLLREDGVCFVSIDDVEVVHLKAMCDSLFGEENCLGLLPTVMNLKGNNDEFGFAGTHEYTLVYARDKAMARLGELSLSEEEQEDWEEDERGPFKRGANLKSTGQNAPRSRRPNLFFPLYLGSDGVVAIERRGAADREIFPITDGHEMSWRWGKDRFRDHPHDVIAVDDGKDPTFYKKQRPSFGDLPSKKPKSVLYKPEYSSGNGTAALRDLFGAKLFDVPPKPPMLIADLIAIGCPDDGIVLDFFAGSGTTAQAALSAGGVGGVRRQFILVQLPEPVDPDSAAGKAGFKTIADICKERVRRVIKKLDAEEAGMLARNGDTATPDRGFRVYKLAESSFKPWKADGPKDGQSLGEHMFEHVEHVLPDRSADDLLYEILLKSGFPLTTPVETLELAGKTVFSVAGGALVVCLDRELTLDVIRAMAKLTPERVVCLDSGFAGNDQLKANAVLEFRDRGVTSFRTV